jgi:GTP-binding protein
VLPVIALVGRPNVGKSTLFNQLTRSRDALVADQPGLTRDRQYGIGQQGKFPYVVIDTGGISGDTDGIDGLMEQQVLAAIEEADYLLFLVDARDGLNAVDEFIAGRLRRTGKPISLLLNKSENVDRSTGAADFYSLGLGEPVFIAAAHGRGIKSMIHDVLASLPDTGDNLADSEKVNQQGVQVAIIGRPNVGKSTLVNRLLGEDRVVAFDRPGTTRDAIAIPFRHNDKTYTLIDTAGVRRRARINEAVEKFSVIKTLQTIQQANVVLLVLDAQQGVSEQDATLAGHVLDSGCALVVVINKWDGLHNDERDRIKIELQRKLPFLNFAEWHFISALHGSGVGLLMDAVDKAYKAAMMDMKTPELTQILEQAVMEHQPPLVRGRRIKLRYAHQGGKNPPLVVIHGKQTDEVPHTYQRFLMNRFREALCLHGTPLRIEFRSGDNPYAGRHNKLTQRQQQKKRRLMKYVKRKSK